MNVSGTYYDYGQKPINETNAFCFLAWNRNTINLNRKSQYDNYSVHWVHGHDPQQIYQENVINLDTRSFKGNNEFYGEYTIFHCKPKHVCSLEETSVLEEDIKNHSAYSVFSFIYEWLNQFITYLSAVLSNVSHAFNFFKPRPNQEQSTPFDELQSQP